MQSLTGVGGYALASSGCHRDVRGLADLLGLTVLTCKRNETAPVVRFPQELEQNFQEGGRAWGENSMSPLLREEIGSPPGGTEGWATGQGGAQMGCRKHTGQLGSQRTRRGRRARIPMDSGN